MRYNFLILFALLISTLSCTKEEADLRLPDFDIPKITGYYILSHADDIPRAVGTPNVKLGAKVTDYIPISTNTGYIHEVVSGWCRLWCYPNPSFNIFRVQVSFPPNQMAIKRLWITRAQPDETLANSLIDIGATNMNAGGAPLIQIESTSGSFEIDVSSFEEGYYRIYVKVDEYLLYDNLVVYDPYKYLNY